MQLFSENNLTPAENACHGCYFPDISLTAQFVISFYFNYFYPKK